MALSVLYVPGVTVNHNNYSQCDVVHRMRQCDQCIGYLL